MSLVRSLRRLLGAFALWTLGAAGVCALPTAAQIKVAFDAIDTTQNGAINAEEWNRASFALFRVADHNNNNFIDPDELQTSPIAQDTFLRADTDHDGRLSVSEFMEVRRAIFQVADIDRDDKLAYVEFELLIVMEQVGWLDRNRDGRIQISELRDSLAKAFEQLDLDRNGALSPAETAFMPAGEIARFDKNRDSQLGPDEFAGGYRAVLLGEL